MTDVTAPPTVVVGVKGTTRSRGAIRLAAREAALRGAGLLAVTAYSAESALGVPAGRPLAVVHTAEEERLRAESVLREAVVDALGDQAVAVALQALPGRGGRVLVEAARKVNAELVVLASRDAGSVKPGGVSQYVLRNSPCPVLVVPAAAGVENQFP